MHVIRWKKATLQSNMAYAFNYMILEKAKLWRHKNISGCQGVNRQTTVGFQGSGPLWSILEWWIYVITDLAKLMEWEL